MNPFNQLRWVYLIWTFPGIVIHELAHKEFCRYYQIPVKEVCYFQLDDPAGYVIHARPRRYIPAFMISIAPVFVNTGIAFVGGMLFAVLLLPFDGVLVLLDSPIEMLLGAFVAAWIGISTGVHALPSDQDAREIWSQTKENWYNPLVLVVIPIVTVIVLLNRLRQFHIHTLGGLAVFALGVYLGVNTDILFGVLADFVEEYTTF